MNIKLVMAKPISHGKVRDDLLDYILHAKVAITQQKVVASIMKALNEN
jgi:hypothetical protein